MPERRFSRLRKSLTFLLPDGWRGEVVDLSATGLRIQSIVVLEKNAVIEGSLVLLDGRQLKLKGKVVWIRPPDHLASVPAEIGLELVDIPEEYLGELSNLFADTT